MSVNLPAPSNLLAIKGVQLGYAEAYVRKPNRKDVLVVAIDSPNAVVSGVFTKNRFCAAPVQICQKHLSLENNSIKALVINTGIANAGTGDLGYQNALKVCEGLAKELNCNASQILPFSTGVIMEHLPVEKIVSHLPICIQNLKSDQWLIGAETIMTTDTAPKAFSKQVEINGHTISFTGMSKGAGMIHPNMATMLGFVACDVAISRELLDKAMQESTEVSFNSITIDGDTSTNDSYIVIATGQTNLPTITSENSPEYHAFKQALTEISIELAQAIVRDGEGATKFMTVQIEKGTSREECKQIAFAVAHSPLVKTAFFASDPNLGRILCAIGYSGIENLDVNQIQLYLGDVLVAENGGRALNYVEADAQAIMSQAEILIRVVLNRGEANATVWTCDFSHEYVSINADYRS